MASRGVMLKPSDARAIAKGIRRLKNQPVQEAGTRAPVTVMTPRSLATSVVIKNDTGEKLEPFSVVRVSRLVTKMLRGSAKPGDSNFFNLANYTWSATAPDAGLTGQYAVLQTRALVGMNGSALMVGVTKVKLDDTDEGDFADPQSENITRMKTCTGGRFPVLAVHTAGADDTWGYVVLGPLAVETFVVLFDGDRTGERYTGHLVNSDGTPGKEVQFRFLGDTGIDDLLVANKHLVVRGIEPWDEDHAAWSDDLPKYWGWVGPDVLNPPLYKAVTDLVGGEITVQHCNSDGTTTGDDIVLKVVP